MTKIRIVQEDEEILVFAGDTLIIQNDRDRVGWYGIDAIRSSVTAVAKALGAEVSNE